jgi:hypothetical protein
VLCCAVGFTGPPWSDKKGLPRYSRPLNLVHFSKTVSGIKKLQDVHRRGGKGRRRKEAGGGEGEEKREAREIKAGLTK